MRVFLFILFIVNCFSQNIYIMIQDGYEKLIITDSNGVVKKRVDIPGRGVWSCPYKTGPLTNSFCFF